MRFTLKDYQTEASQRILATLARSRSDWREHRDRTAFALSATTGSGKTVIAAAVVEALLHGSDEFDVQPDPTAVVLWVSKDPSLNEQTRGRFIECADRIPPGDLVLLDKSYAEDSLQTGTVYFINPDKLASRADFVKHTDTRQVTFWEILENTINDDRKTLYMVLDEAHEGMKAPTNAEQSVVQKIINGNGTNPTMPVVLGISATVRRFDEAMARADKFTKRPNVTIDPKAVQESGLLKNSLWLDIPDEDGDFETTMVRDATLDFVDVSDRWAKYSQREGLDQPVLPLLVVQIPNKAEGEKDTERGRKDEAELIHRVLETIRRHWPEMPTDCVAHVLGDRASLDIGSYTIAKVAPQDVEHDHRIRVLFAKDAISTGWDCPRAEVLVSLRPGQNHTYVTQLLGRMVRTPLAQSTGDERLNSASCYLPRFNKSTAKAVAEEIMGIREPSFGPSGPAIARVLLKPVMLQINAAVPADVRAAVADLPSASKPAASPRPVVRILKAAQAFAQDQLVADADKVAHEALFAVLDGVVDRHKKAIEEQTTEIVTADILRIVAQRGTAESTEEASQRDADAATVEDALRHLRRQLTASVVNRYLNRNIQAALDKGDGSPVDVTGIRAAVAAIGLISVTEGEPSVRDAVDDAADALVRLWLSTKSKEIADLPDSRQPTYDSIREMARGPEPAGIELKTSELVDTVDTDWEPLQTAKKHLLSDGDGNYPLDVLLNQWERASIRAEVAKPEVLGWYRNPSSAGKHSLGVPYPEGDSWKSVQPDLLFVAETGGVLRASIIDPHGAHLSDSSSKLKALASFADENGADFDRILAIGVEKENKLYALDLQDSKVRRAVYESPADGASIKALFDKHGTIYATISE